MSQPDKPAAHTPGPWLIAGDDEPMPGVPAIEISTETGPDWKLVAYVMCDGETNRLADVDRANARLIAVAPELIEALRRIAGGNFDGASNLAAAGSWQDIVTALQGIARAAIAKAEAV